MRQGLPRGTFFTQHQRRRGNDQRPKSKLVSKATMHYFAAVMEMETSWGNAD